MKRTILFLFFLSTLIYAQNSWNLVWTLNEYPFIHGEPKPGSEMSVVKAGFDTDEDGWGEFLCAWTDMSAAGNYILMYEASGDNKYDLVWYYKYPVSTSTFPGIVIGDIDNNGKVEIITTLPSVVSATNPNPPRLWVFEWNGVKGENKYGRYVNDISEPTSEWNYNLDDGIDFRPYSLIIEDIDNDGRNELITGVRQSARPGGTKREVLVASVTGELGGFGSWVVEYNFQDTFGGSIYNVTTGDLDNDGNKEIYALIWDMFTLRIIECTGEGQYTITTNLDKIYQDAGIDYGSVDGVRVADVNNDGVNEWYMAGTETKNSLFMISGITDVSAITKDDVKEFYHIPIIDQGKFRTMHIADPDKDGKLSLLIAGERNGQIYDLEYKGEGDPADSTSWDLSIIFDIWEKSGIVAPGLSPRFFYGSPAADMDRDGKDEYLFVNYSSDFTAWTDDAYLYMIEIDAAVGVKSETYLVPSSIELKQNYPNPFNPSTVIEFGLNKMQQTKLVVYDLLGREIATLVNETLPAGSHRVAFDAGNISAGTYFYTLTAGNTVKTNKMILLK